MEIKIKNGRAYLSFPYNTEKINYLRKLPDRKYHPDTKEWEIPVEDVEDFKNAFMSVDELIDIKEIKKELKEIPEGYQFKTKPFNHQIEGVRFGLTQERFLLGDDPGLGKSKQVIDWVNCLKCTGKILIICGVNSLKYNWLNEIATHSDFTGWVLGTRYRKTTGKSYEGSTQDKIDDLNKIDNINQKFIITNIESLRLGSEKINKVTYKFPIADKLKELCSNGKISAIIFDECHTAKNPSSLQGKALLRIKAKYMVAMSGTPLMNNPLDLFVPLKWLGYEDNSYYQFRQYYCRLGGYSGAEVIGYKNLGQLKSKVADIMIRRLKNDVLDLPEKLHKIEYVEMNTPQSKLYNEVLMGITQNINKLYFSANPLSMLIHLRQITGFPAYLNEKVGYGAKINRLKELVEEITSTGEKVVIFSNWTTVTSAVKNILKNYNPAYITGEISAEDRMTQVNKFQNDDNCKIIIGTLGAMGTGLTLTASKTVIFMDSPWNRALKDQAEDRCHRIGSTGTVNIITLVCKNTIDEKIENLVEKKGKISDALIDNKISMQDLNYLLS